MVRPFTLRDLALVRRLSEQGVSLHAESALADNLHPLRGALLNMVVRSECPTLIWKSENRERAGFIQLLLEEDRQHAHILYLSPQLGMAPGDTNGRGSENGEPADNNVDLWLSLLDQAVAEVGKYGVQSLVAEVSETGPELPILRRAGFAIYTRQDIWRLDTDAQTSLDGHAMHALRPRLPKDDWDVQLLYANTVPRLVQLVEPAPPLTADSTWIQRDENDELVAFVQIHAGEVASWMRFFIHPSAESDAEEILNSALLVMGKEWSKPVYLCARRYEGWMPSVLQRAGFRKWGSQAILVKHTVHHVQTKSPQRAVGIENAGIPISTPYSQTVPSQPSAHSGPPAKVPGASESERSARMPALNN
ncbi:MAG: hypothetical protein ACK2UK_13570 [Candidatus Promineifilaceae bacterium]